MDEERTLDRRNLAQHRNSADSNEFNNKAQRRLRPAGGTSKGDIEKKSSLMEGVLADAHSSHSLDDVDLHRT